MPVCTSCVRCTVQAEDTRRSQRSRLKSACAGYGDVTPIHTVERLVAMGIMTVGVFFFGFLIGALAELVQARLAPGARSSTQC